MSQEIPETDLEFREDRITDVGAEEGGWSITRESGWSFWVASEHGIEPKIGMLARFYGRGLGFPVRGLMLDGRVVFYRTPEQEEERHRQWCQQKEEDQRRTFQENKAELDYDYEHLPPIFQRRIDKFRKTNPDFRWQHEAYEMSCCRDAVKIARACGTPEKVVEYGKMDYAQQKALVPDLFEGHSGHSFGFAVRLAYHYLNNEENVYLEHGALTPFIGCEDYGCPHPPPGYEGK